MLAFCFVARGKINLSVSCYTAYLFAVEIASAGKLIDLIGPITNKNLYRNGDDLNLEISYLL